MRSLVRYLQEEAGASAAEFALVVIPFIGLVLGIVGLSMLLYANQTLQFATEAAARYYSVQTNLGNTPDVSAYALNAYKGPAVSPTFTPARGGCGPNGFQVTGTGTFPLNTGLYNTSVSLQAHACFP